MPNRDRSRDTDQISISYSKSQYHKVAHSCAQSLAGALSPSLQCPLRYDSISDQYDTQGAPLSASLSHVIKEARQVQKEGSYLGREHSRKKLTLKLVFLKSLLPLNHEWYQEI